MLTARVFTWVVDKSGWFVIADAVAHLGWPIRSHESATSVLFASPAVFVDVLREGLGLVGPWYLSDIPISVLDIRYSTREDLSLIRQKCDEISINRPSNAKDVFRLVLRDLKTLAEQSLLLAYAEGLRSEAQGWAARLQSLECQVAVHAV